MWVMGCVYRGIIILNFFFRSYIPCWLCKLCKMCNTKSMHLHKNLRSLHATRYREFYLLCYLTSLYISMDEISGKLIYRFIFHSNRKTRETCY